MIIIRTICDRCKREITWRGRTANIKVTAAWNGSQNIGVINGKYDRDLCADCTKKFEDFLMNEENENET